MKWETDQLKWCRDKVFDWGTEKNFSVKDFRQNLFITIAVGFGSLIVTHIIFAALSSCKGSKSPKKPEEEKLKE